MYSSSLWVAISDGALKMPTTHESPLGSCLKPRGRHVGRFRASGSCNSESKRGEVEARSEVDAIDHRRLRDHAQDDVLALSHRKPKTNRQSSFKRTVWRRASETDRMSLFDFQPSQLCPPKVLCGSRREALCALPADPEPLAILGFDLGHESTDLQFAGDLEIYSMRPY